MQKYTAKLHWPGPTTFYGIIAKEKTFLDGGVS